jgi:hypothetical protein
MIQFNKLLDYDRGRKIVIDCVETIVYVFLKKWTGTYDVNVTILNVTIHRNNL